MDCSKKESLWGLWRQKLTIRARISLWWKHSPAAMQAAVELEHEQSEVQRPAYTPPLLPMATRLLRQVGQIFRQQFQIDPPVARLVDAKLRRKIAEKKQAHGQKLEM